MRAIRVDLPPAERDRLAKLLGSDHDGEVLNAARLADRLVRDHGITWLDAITAPVDPQLSTEFATCSRSSGNRTPGLDLENLVYARVAKSKQRRKRAIRF